MPGVLQEISGTVIISDHANLLSLIVPVMEVDRARLRSSINCLRFFVFDVVYPFKNDLTASIFDNGDHRTASCISSLSTRVVQARCTRCTSFRTGNVGVAICRPLTRSLMFMAEGESESNTKSFSMRMTVYGISKKFPSVRNVSCDQLERWRQDAQDKLVILVSIFNHDNILYVSGTTVVRQPLLLLHLCKVATFKLYQSFIRLHINLIPYIICIKLHSVFLRQYPSLDDQTPTTPKCVLFLLRYNLGHQASGGVPSEPLAWSSAGGPTRGMLVRHPGDHTGFYKYTL